MNEFYNQNHNGSSAFVPTQPDVYISNSLFHDCISSQCGGAISCTSNTSVNRLFIEETTFTTCKTNSLKGGGIYFSNTKNGSCVISRTCSLNCSSTFKCYIQQDELSTRQALKYVWHSDTYGQYAYIETNSKSPCKNEVNDSTITGITKDNDCSRYALALYYGNIKCSSVNITKNECKHCPALGCAPAVNTDAVTCYITFTSIVNNTASNGYGCILLDETYSSQLISTSNIINNKRDDDDDFTSATIVTYGNLCINESCIIGNNEDSIVFYEGSDSCQIKIIKCTLDSDIIQSSRYEGSLTIINSREYDFINALAHIVTGDCDSFLDSYGTLTAAIIQGKHLRRTKNQNSYLSKRLTVLLLSFLIYLLT